MKSYFEETEKQLRRALIFIVINIGLTAIVTIIPAIDPQAAIFANFIASFDFSRL